jgi:TonB family protein
MSLSLRRAGRLLVLFMAWTTSVLAQEPTALSPPVLQGSSDVPYPAGAQGDAAVVLELIVEADGIVSRADVLEGAEPFAEHAKQAVLAWRFDPARRGDTPVAARIRVRVEFHQEQPLNAPSATGPTPPPVTSVPPTPAPLTQRPTAPEAALDVTVRGYRHEIGQTTLSATDVREMPGAFGDPFRAIEALPGVMPVVSGLPYFYIRGAPPNNNGFYIDGIRVPLLFHVGIGQGVIHPGLVDRVDFYPSVAPASYGGFAGAIIAGQTREPATTFHGEANLRLIDAGTLLEAPFDSGRGSVLVAGHYGYPGPIIGAITPDVKLGYWDYQARTTWRIADRDTLGVFAFGSHDYLATMQSGFSIEQLVSDFHRVDLRYDHALNDGRVRVAVTLGHDSQGATPTYATDTSAAVRLEFDQTLSPTLRIRAGAAARFDDYGFKQTATPVDERGRSLAPEVPSTADPPPTNVTAGAHADVVWRVAPRVEIVPGVRVDMFESSRANAVAGSARTRTTLPAFDPRLSARVTITDDLAWLSSFGLSHQYPTLRVGSLPAAVVSVPGFALGSARLQTVAQASQGAEIALPADFVLTATGFVSGWWGLTDLTATCYQIMPPTSPANTTGEPRPEPPYQCPDDDPVKGRAFGVELLVRRPLSKRLSGWLAYTLSRSTRAAHFPTLDGGEAVATVPSEFDRTHVLSAILAYDLGSGWHAGGRFVFYTGAPYSLLAGSVPVPPYNSRRMPGFFRLDLRLEKRWALGRDGWIAFVLEGQNVTLSKEVTGLGLDCVGLMSAEAGTTHCTQSKVGPITIPSVGVEAFF